MSAEEQSFPFIPYHPVRYPEQDMVHRAKAFHEWLETRRSVRFFSDRPVPKEVMLDLIMTASTAPSGAHKQPWTFALIGDPEMKRKIRQAAEEEEYENYHGRLTPEWKEDLAPLGTDWHKEFLETAPWLVVIFKKAYDLDGDTKRKHYYVTESVGIAAGFFLVSAHHAGLVTLTHTPSPMDFLSQLLGRPANERPFLLIPVGYPADNCVVPDIKRKGINEVYVEY